MPQQLDAMFPFFVLFYGLVMSTITQIPVLKSRLEDSGCPPEVAQWFYSHRTLGLVCLAVGGLWSLQRLIL